MLIFLDSETTGLERDDKIVSIALIATQKDASSFVKKDLVNEGKKIPPKASSINHITNEMLHKKPKLSECESYTFLQKHNSSENTLVLHNANFDLQKLVDANLLWQGGVIDTLRVTKHLIPECEFFSLQYLRYELKLYKQEEKLASEIGIKTPLHAHEALSDALLVKCLYNYLLDFATQEKMQELSFENVLLKKLEFGKYAGKYIEEIAMNDRGYLEWMLQNILDLDEDLRYSITYYLEEGV